MPVSASDRVTWFVDGNNVVGAGADGWWNDRPAAFERFAQAVARWANDHEAEVVLVFDGAPIERVAALAGGPLRIEFAPRRGRDAADDRIVELVDEQREASAGGSIVVATSDRGLVRRLREGTEVEGAGAFRRRLGLAMPRGR